MAENSGAVGGRAGLSGAHPSAGGHQAEAGGAGLQGPPRRCARHGRTPCSGSIQRVHHACTSHVTPGQLGRHWDGWTPCRDLCPTRCASGHVLAWASSWWGSLCWWGGAGAGPEKSTRRSGSELGAAKTTLTDRRSYIRSYTSLRRIGDGIGDMPTQPPRRNFLRLIQARVTASCWWGSCWCGPGVPSITVARPTHGRPPAAIPAPPSRPPTRPPSQPPSQPATHIHRLHPVTRGQGRGGGGATMMQMPQRGRPSYCWVMLTG